MSVLKVPPADTQAEAESLLERARRLSDIRGPNSPSFRLKAAFSFIDDELETLHGTYTEFWASDSKWRKEIAIGERKRIEVASDRKLWEAESKPLLPEKALRVDFAANIFPPRSARLEFEKVEHLAGGRATRCAVTKASRGRSAFCFDDENGVLVEHVIPHWTRYHLTDFGCLYGDFRKFGSQWFPREIQCRQGGHRQMDVQVTELDAVNLDDAKLFDPPGDAIELGRCTAEQVDAKGDYTPAPLQPAGLSDRSLPVTLRLVVDPQGNPRDIHVIQPAGKKLDDMAVETVSKWRFKPATCNGEPMAQQIQFQVAFRPY
jgi:TonB family protein